MAIRHIIKCDGPQCGKEQELTVIQARTPNAQPDYQRPPNWPSADGKDFCCYGCMATYASDREQHPEKYPGGFSIIAQRHLSANGPW